MKSSLSRGHNICTDKSNIHHIHHKETSKPGGPSGDANDISVSEILSQTNSVLYDCDDTGDSVFVSDSVIEYSDMASGSDKSGVTSRSSDASNAVLLEYLKKIDTKLGNMDGRISGIEKRLGSLEDVKTKINLIDTELKSLKVTLNDRNRLFDERLNKIEDKVESCDFAVGLVNDRIVTLEKEKDMLKDALVYLQSQSMRNNLVFSNIPEDLSETNEITENKVRDFIHNQLKLAKELVDQIAFERVHRNLAETPGKL